MSKIIIPQSELPYVIDQLTNTLPETYDKTVRFRYRVVNNNRNIYSDWSIIGSVQQQTLLERIDDGLPTGGNPNDLPVKQGPGDYDVGWQPISTLLPTNIVYDGDNSLIPPGGLDGQVLTKISNANYAVDWEDPSGGGGGTGGAILGTVNTVGVDAVTTTVTLSGATVPVSALNISGHTLGVGATVGVVSAIDDVNWDWYVVSRYQPSGVPYSIVPGDLVSPPFPKIVNTAITTRGAVSYFPNCPTGGPGLIAYNGWTSLTQASSGYLPLIFNNAGNEETQIQHKGQYLFSTTNIGSGLVDPPFVYYWDHNVSAWGNIGRPSTKPSFAATSGSYYLGKSSNGNICLICFNAQSTSPSGVWLGISWFNTSGANPLVGTWSSWWESGNLSQGSVNGSTNNGAQGFACFGGNGAFTGTRTGAVSTNPLVPHAAIYGQIHSNYANVYALPRVNGSVSTAFTPKIDGTFLFAGTDSANNKLKIYKKNVNGTVIAQWQTTLNAYSSSDWNVAATGDILVASLLNNTLLSGQASSYFLNGAAMAAMDSEGFAWFPAFVKGASATISALRIYRIGETSNITLVDEIPFQKTYNTVPEIAAVINALGLTNHQFNGGPHESNTVGLWAPTTQYAATTFTSSVPSQLQGIIYPPWWNYYVYNF